MCISSNSKPVNESTGPKNINNSTVKEYLQLFHVRDKERITMLNRIESVARLVLRLIH